MSIRIRPFAILGSYPREDLKIGSDLLFHSDKWIFSCVQNRLVERAGKFLPDEPGFELDNWTIQEVRMLASIFVGNGECSSIRLYPLPLYQDIDVKGVDDVMQNPDLLQPILEKTERCDDYLMHSNRGLIPTSSSEYRLADFDERKIEQTQLFWRHLDEDDPILIRGLHSILKSDMLRNHQQFLGSSLTQIHISLDATYSMVLRHLKQEGVSNPTSQDAQAFVEDWWGIPRTGLRFFEDYYSDRIRNFHTDSRFGAEPIPFFCLDDIIDLTELLKGLFFMFVTGEKHDQSQWSLDQATFN